MKIFFQLPELWKKACSTGASFYDPPLEARASKTPRVASREQLPSFKMKKSLTSVSSLALLAAGLVGFAAQRAAFATPLKAARVTQLTKDVKFDFNQENSKPVTLGDSLAVGSAAQTGVDSRLELTYPDQTVARLGTQTRFSTVGIRALELNGGSLFLHVPKDAGMTEVKTALVTVSTSGTVALETFNFPATPGSVSPTAIAEDARYKLTVLAGEARLCLSDRPDECVTVKTGETLLGGMSGFQGAPVAFNVEDWAESNVLITEFTPLSKIVLAAIGIKEGDLTMAQLTMLQTSQGVDAGSVSGVGTGTINPANIGAAAATSANECQQTICHNGSTLVLPCKAAQSHLAKHRDDRPGPCP